MAAASRRHEIGMHYLNALLMKIAGTISNEEFQRRVRRRPDEVLGIGGATELPNGPDRKTLAAGGE